MNLVLSSASFHRMSAVLHHSSLPDTAAIAKRQQMPTSPRSLESMGSGRETSAKVVIMTSKSGESPRALFQSKSPIKDGCVSRLLADQCTEERYSEGNADKDGSRGSSSSRTPFVFDIVRLQGLGRHRCFPLYTCLFLQSIDARKAQSLLTRSWLRATATGSVRFPAISGIKFRRASSPMTKGN